MKINALVKGMSLIEQGWIHEEGLIVLSKILSFGSAKTSLFIAYNVDKDEYLAIRGDQFLSLSLDNSILDMPAMIDSSSLPKDEDFSIEIYVADGDYDTLELMDEEYDEQFYYDEEFYDEEDFYGEEEYDEIVLDNLYDLYGLMSKGWSEEAIDRLIEDLQSLEDERE